MHRVPIQDVFDLHSFLPREALAALEDYLEEAVRLGLAEVRVIHGRGKGVRRAQVRQFLAKRPEVLGFSDAPPERGGFGATVVVLRSTFNVQR